MKKDGATAPGGKYKIGLMGGTFNPIHYGHLLAAEQARSRFRLDEVIFIPSGRPPHKNDKTVAGAEHRYLMTVLATSTNPRFTVSRAELDRKDLSYTIDTVRYFARLLKSKNPDIYFITGYDAVLEILTWRNPDKILELCTIISASRPGYDIRRLKEILDRKQLGRIRILEAAALAISSTDIRSRLAEGLPIKYLLPDSVEEYIYKNKLYRTG